jgi:hypothetical protein
LGQVDNSWLLAAEALATRARAMRILNSICRSEPRLEMKIKRLNSAVTSWRQGEPAPEIQIDPAAFVFHKAERLTICFFL